MKWRKRERGEEKHTECQAFPKAIVTSETIFCPHFAHITIGFGAGCLHKKKKKENWNFHSINSSKRSYSAPVSICFDPFPVRQKERMLKINNKKIIEKFPIEQKIESISRINKFSKKIYQQKNQKTTKTHQTNFFVYVKFVFSFFV